MTSTVHIAAAKYVVLGAGSYDLHLLCAKGELKTIQEYWTRFSEQIESKSRGLTPLQEASRKGLCNVVDFLLSKGAKVNALSIYGETALYLAAEGRHTDCEMLLMMHGASIDHGSDGKKAKDSRDKNLLRILKGNIDVISTPLKPSLVNRGLASAMRLEHIPYMTKFILLKPTKLDQIIQEAESAKKHLSIAFLLLVQAAITDDLELVERLYSTNKTGNSLSADTRRQMSHLPTTLPLKLARESNHTRVFDLILTRTGLNSSKSAVDISWEGLELTTLSKYILSRIEQVSCWSISRNHLTSLSFFGVPLDMLCVLDVSHNHIKEVDPAIFDLLKLTSLNLSHNNLSDIPKPKIVGKSCLIRLDISHNKFHQVPYSVVYFPQLSYLNISFNPKIECLPEWIATLEKLDDLRLEGLPLLNQIRGGFHDTLQTLKVKLDKTRQVRDMKMIVTGLSQNGKSLLINQLRKCAPSAAPTLSDGVSTVDWLYRPSPEHEEYNFSIWEIGGSEDSYEGIAIEKVLYTSHAMYILVFSLVDGVAGVNDLRVWLNAISGYASPSCVLLVGTGLDQLVETTYYQVVEEIEKSVKSLLSDFSGVLLFGNPCFIPVSLTNETNDVQLIRDTMYELATSFTLGDGQPYMDRRVPLSAVGLKGEVNKYRSQVQKGEFSPFLNTDRMKALVASLRDIEVISTGEFHTIIQFLSSVGSLLHFPSSGMYFLDPNWVLQKIRSIFAHLEEFLDPNSIENGICTNDHLRSVLSKEFAMPLGEELKEDQTHEPKSQIADSFISLLVRYKLLIPVTADFSQFVVPSHLPSSPSRKEMVSMITDKHTPVLWKYSLKQPLDRTLWLSILKSMFIMRSEHMNHSSFSIWKDSVVFKEEGVVVSYSQELSNVVLYSLGHSQQFIELSDSIDDHLPSNSVVSVTCPMCLKLKNPDPYEFSANVFMEAIIQGEEQVACQYLDEADNHFVSIAELTPFMAIHPTHVNLYSDDRHTCTDDGVKCMRTKLSTTQVFKQLNTGSLILKDFDCPFITVKQGRLLALAVHTEEKEAVQVFQEPTIGSLADLTQGIPRVVLYRIAIQIARIILSVPRVSPNIDNLQLWSVDPNCLLHCSLSINHSYELESSGITEQSKIRKWVFFVKKVTEFASTSAIISSNGTFTPNYYCLNKLVDECLKTDNTLSLKSVVSLLSLVLMQLIAGVCPLPELSAVCGACNVLKSHHANAINNSMSNEDVLEPLPMYNEVWIPSHNEETSQLKLSVLEVGSMSLNTIEIQSLKPIKVIAIHTCGESVWLSTQLSDNLSCISIFDLYTYNIVHNIKMKGNVVTCIESSGNQVFLGTKAGFLFVFPSSVETIKQGRVDPTHKYISKKEINSLVVIETVLWISCGNCIFLFEWKVFKFKGFLKHNTGESMVGELVSSEDIGMVYSANIGGKCLSVWRSAKEKHMYDLNMEEIMSNIGEERDIFISALNITRDCVWVGLGSGHLLIFNLQTILVAWLRPYSHSINILCFVPDLIRGTSEQHILSCGRGVDLPNFHGNPPCESNPEQEVLLLWQSELAVNLENMKALEENGGWYLDSYHSLNAMIKKNGFKDEIRIPKHDIGVKSDILFVEHVTTETGLTEYQRAPSTSWGSLTLELKDEETTEIHFDNVPTLEQVQLKILDILNSGTTDDIGIDDIHMAYRYKNQDTLVAVSSEDDLLCYFDLTERPNLLLDHLFN